MSMKRFAPLYILSLVLSGTAGLSSEPVHADERVDDPAESVNRAIFAANQFVDRNLLRPIAEGYHKAVPTQAQSMVGNFVSNLSQPTVLVNDVLQGNARRAWNTTQRFTVNSTVGVAGLFDPATEFNLPHHSADFGQTFGVWGVKPGPAVQLPLLGPSNVRDTVGSVVNSFANPVSFIPGNAMANVRFTRSALSAVDGRARQLEKTKALEGSSGDYYVASRDAQARKQAALVAEAKQGHVHLPRR
ncbi:VacJ family lipoprotein [Bradyrhizobium sp. Arg237L]|uniref:MlaA family lipoprotein n=1 Tax=Bradyrhizobium sp. Arg237L TaxID=3003352 RepID=UPI00249DD855|nr:VacJ family lipoprotein [Bradyrhizobium sp. Arg237L]MDI4238288.1 VacJ family lipoprotein [Bradyrhizobium sp. Arg237L]